ncbi:unnamed protein product [Mytilus edulis]|uniref:Ankyrin repeat protein n=1 Tax=Mytilus edulis TaxID=6550 RepID=A0A8S3SK79_MYTED|nr:unnamed protein product [Mytilus edulis]
MLLNFETDVNISTSEGITPLMLACKENHISVVETLLVSNANVAQCNEDKCSPLEYACTPGNTDIINVLLEHGANINWANKKELPLFILHKNADINSKDLFGGTPLHEACFKGDNEIIKILLKKGAKINITDNSGKSSVAIAKESGFRSIVEFLDNANTV